MNTLQVLPAEMEFYRENSVAKTRSHFCTSQTRKLAESAVNLDLGMLKVSFIEQDFLGRGDIFIPTMQLV